MSLFGQFVGKPTKKVILHEQKFTHVIYFSNYENEEKYKNMKKIYKYKKNIPFTLKSVYNDLGFDKEGMVFDHWKTDTDDNIADESTMTSDENTLVLSACWADTALYGKVIYESCEDKKTYGSLQSVISKNYKIESDNKQITILYYNDSVPLSTHGEYNNIIIQGEDLSDASISIIFETSEHVYTEYKLSVAGCETVEETENTSVSCVYPDIESENGDELSAWLTTNGGKSYIVVQRTNGNVNTDEISCVSITPADNHAPELTSVQQGDRAVGICGFGHGSNYSITLNGSIPGGFKTSDVLRLNGYQTGSSEVWSTMNATSYVTSSSGTTITLGNGLDNDSPKPDGDWEGKTAEFVLERAGEKYAVSCTWQAA